VSLWLRLPRLWRDVMPQHTEDIMEHSEHMPRSGKMAFLANDVWRYKGVCQEMPPMPKTREHQLARCDASHEQSPSRTIWCMGDWFHGALPQVRELWIHFGGWLCGQMELSIQNMLRECSMKSYFLALVYPRWS
jgi:hypothetical protein